MQHSPYDNHWRLYADQTVMVACIFAVLAALSGLMIAVVTAIGGLPEATAWILGAAVFAVGMVADLRLTVPEYRRARAHLS